MSIMKLFISCNTIIFILQYAGNHLNLTIHNIKFIKKFLFKYENKTQNNVIILNLYNHN